MKYETLSKMNLSDTKVLILGGGFLGNVIGDYLAGIKCMRGVKIVRSELVNYHDNKTLWRLLLEQEPDFVINCSGYTGRPNIDQAEEEQDKCWEYNVNSPLRVARHCAQYGIKHIHISSGCIYDGYEKNFTEEDVPNFGLWNNSSVYSRTKHAFEFLSKDFNTKILRIRMPIYGNHDRCYLTKIKGYNSLIDYKNSKTYVLDLCEFIHRLILQKDPWTCQDIYNVVNPQPLTTKQVCELMFLAKDYNSNWKFVPIDEIPIVAPRSNCVLDCSKANAILPLRTEFECLLDLYSDRLDDLQLTPEMLGLPK